MKPVHLKSLRAFLAVAFVLSGGGLTHGQSGDQNFPTPITSNEISGTIKARAIGDSRLTTHFYAFDAGQGDIFINVVARNVSGDIDVFSADGLRPLAKMVLYGEDGTVENGRLIYMRKPERLLLRVEGRTPNDEPATYQIKFGGSFVALLPSKEEEPPTIADNKNDQKNIDVNSVGTVTPPKSKPQPKPKSTPLTGARKAVASNNRAKSEGPTRERVKPIVVVEDYPGTSETGTTRTPARVEPKPSNRPVSKKPSPPKPDPLANVRLVILMKDGGVIERSFGEVKRFSFDKGVLTVVGKDGKITSYSLLDVDKVTVQ